MTILTRRSLLLARLESTFRTDAEPTELLVSNTGIDCTADLSANVFTVASHGFSTGDLVQVTLESGSLPAELSADTDYFVIDVTTNTFSLATTYANALAGTVMTVSAAVGDITIARLDSDAFEVIDLDYAPDVTVLEREVAVPHLSPVPGQVGRKLATVTFQHEIKSNGVTDGGQAPRVGVLLRGAGFAETRFGETGSEPERILDDAALPVNDPTGAFTYTKTGTYAGTLPRVVQMTCTTGGGTGTAEFTVSSPASGAQAAVETTGVVMTNGSPFTLAESATITPTITTSFAIGDTFVIFLSPPGHYYTPVSTGFESLTMYVYFDGLRHIMTGSRGTFTAEGEAGSFGTFSFTFTGDFNVATDVAIPSAPTYESTLPPQIELAALAVAGGEDDVDFALCAQSFSIDMGIEVVPRECINGPNSLEGAIITGRSPTATFNPEVELEATHPFWSNLSSQDRVVWALRVGSVQGNVVAFQAPYAQYTGVTYGDRDGIRIYDVNMSLRTPSGGGNDELRIVFS